MKSFPGRLGIQQRVVPDYRVEFFDLLAESCEGGLGVFAGDVLPQESIPTSATLKVAEYVKARNYHFRDIRSASYFLWQGELVHWLENWKPDVLIVEANPRYLSTNRGVDWMHARAKPVIGWGLGAPPIEKQNSIGDKFNRGIRNYLRRRLHNQIDAYIAYSHKGAREFREIKNPEKPVYVAANAVTRSPVGPAHERKLEFDGNPIVLYVGRIQARKRLDNLIDACSDLPEEMQPELWIVGDGPDLAALKLFANDTYPKTEFKGRKSGDELANIFKKADLFVLPGTGGLAVQEALSYALPVIVAEGDGTQRELVKPDNGWLIPSNDEDALLETLKLALSDPARLRHMGICSYRIVQREVNIEQMVNTFVSAIHNTTWTGRR